MTFFPDNPEQAQGQDITSHPFWPAINTAATRDVMRIDGDVTEPRLKHAVITAIAQVNQDLVGYRNEQAELTLADVPAEIIGGESQLVHHYKRAVYCLARANLIERLRDYDTTKDGEGRAESLDQTVTDLRRDARFAVRAIIGITHTTVELI
ncbi:head completion/stabilization protein [Motilimonas sp. 1_MG-2023]|uniref:head completion/stabilization protein n=1 Tax=Motilimonas sp. 1_MG-2023 TaxID=3062672 RepID=UPI0026E31E16|nr:head completion/stabilization protein [Motilimonas sp. 1_MG-2023]MDO6525447.1 head completion/stabilization protein [Motilimonas sp. 1_MG-2023]